MTTKLTLYLEKSFNPPQKEIHRGNFSLNKTTHYAFELLIMVDVSLELRDLLEKK